MNGSSSSASEIHFARNNHRSREQHGVLKTFYWLPWSVELLIAKGDLEQTWPPVSDWGNIYLQLWSDQSRDTYVSLCKACFSSTITSEIVRDNLVSASKMGPEITENCYSLQDGEVPPHSCPKSKKTSSLNEGYELAITCWAERQW